MTFLCPKDSINIAYMCLEKQNTYQDSGLLYPTWKTSLEDILELPNLPDNDQEAWSHL